jgi:acetylornithine deacetylase/succinyl-diaminopimelate desuccinylase-like protein
MRPSILCAVLTLGGAPAFAQGPARPLNWDSLAAEAVRNLSAYLAINSTNPPGNELATALFLQQVLQRDGIEAQILDTAELGPGRANLYARLHGRGTKKAIALVNHMDVVPVMRQFWTVDPFAGLVQDGYVWGRGALDMKGEGIVQLMALIALKRSGVTLDRDIVFIANADEEVGGGGADLFVQRHADLLKDVEFLMTEGGDNLVEDGHLAYYGVGVAEKRAFWQKITVHGTPSHGSRPTKQNPVPRLVDALSRLGHYETALHATPGVAKYFRDIATRYQAPQRAWLSDVTAALGDSTARAWITSNVYWNAILRNTISLTVVTGSNKTNVIPAEASAEVDIRLLPDQDTAVVRAELLRVVSDTAVHWQTMFPLKAPLDSPIDTDLFRAIVRAAGERDPNVRVTTPMLTGATDRPFYRALGIVTYGFDPFKVEKADAQRGVHGNDERVSVASVGFGVHYLYDVLRYAQ